MKAIEFYLKIYDNLTLSRNLSKLFSSIRKHMTILPWAETYQSYSVPFQNIWQSYIDRKVIKAIQFYLKTYNNLMFIGKLIKDIQFYSKIYDNLTLIRNLSKLFRSTPKHMTILHWLVTYQSYSVLFQNIWESYVDRKLIKAIPFYSKTYDNLTLIGNLSKLYRSIPKHMTSLGWLGNLLKLFSSIPKHMAILCWSETYQSYSVLFQNIWKSCVDWKLIKAIQFYSKTYDNLTLIGNLSKLYRSIPKHMTVLG